MSTEKSQVPPAGDQSYQFQPPPAYEQTYNPHQQIYPQAQPPPSYSIPPGTQVVTGKKHSHTYGKFQNR